MRIRLLVPTFLLAATTFAMVPTLVSAEHECDPYPIGRCGEFQRESVIFCYTLVNGQYLPATDSTAVGAPGLGDLGVPTGVPQLDQSLVYARPGPTLRFVDDPNNAPFPFDTLWQETNNVAGLQMAPFKCGKWTWFAECEPMQWMGPTGVVNKAPDAKIL